jgi:hypothetical protein
LIAALGIALCSVVLSDSNTGPLENIYPGPLMLSPVSLHDKPGNSVFQYVALSSIHSSRSKSRVIKMFHIHVLVNGQIYG